MNLSTILATLFTLIIIAIVLFPIINAFYLNSKWKQELKDFDSKVNTFRFTKKYVDFTTNHLYIKSK